MNRPEEITRLLHASRGGDTAARDALVDAVYPELKKIARAYIGRQTSGHTLQPTALLHEAYLKIAGVNRDWNDRTHFYAVFAAAMRQILVDHARAKGARKRGSGERAVPFDEARGQAAATDEGLVALDEALTRLASHDARKARILELRYFGGLTIEETADAVGVGVATVGREARFAEAWLKKELAG